MDSSAAKPLRLLLIEDSEDDALLLTRELRRGGFAPDTHRVCDSAGLAEALKEPDWDLVITDHNMPGFSSSSALYMVKTSHPDLPVIIVSGSIGEDIAVASMKAGAQDYIMKNSLTRLVPAIERELREAENRRAHREAEETIRHMAFHDPLTGLVNRFEFERRLNEALHRAQDSGHDHTLLYLDLDQFKLINDTCGHIAGDELLRQVAVVLHQQVREADTLARLGGDEFGILLENCPIERAQAIADQMLQSINDFRFIWSDKTFTIGGSIGMVSISQDDDDIAELMKSADMACYAAKDAGRNRYHFFAPDDEDLARRHGEMQWVTRLQQALDLDYLLLYQQTIVPMDGSGGSERNHYEYLLRLDDPEAGILSPGAFLPAAERYNLMPRLDRWVVQNALQHLADLGATSEGCPQMAFINLSGTSLSDPEFFAYIQQQIRHSGVRPECVCFEITETAAIQNMRTAVGFIRDIRAAGCRFALDDFGAGLSSFSYLKTIPVDFLKIDGGFVKDIVDDQMDRAIVRSINEVAHVMGLKTIAEFVEDHAIIEVLQDIGVDFGQGYGVEHPKPLD